MTKPLFFLSLALTWLITMPLTAEKPQAEIKLQQFMAAHPQARFFGKQYFDDEGFFEQVGTADVVYGSELATGLTAEQSARNFYQQIEGVYAEEIGELLIGKQHGVMWDKTRQSHDFQTFRLEQHIAGIPVYRSGIGVLVRNEENFPLVMSSNNLKELQGFDAAAAAFVLPQATEAMLGNAARVLDAAGPFQGAEKVHSVLDNAKHQQPLPVQASAEELVVWAGVTNVPVQPELAIVFIAERGTQKELSNYQKHLIVASVANGQVLYSENQIVADVDGTVSGRSTDSDAALECDPEVAFGLPYAQVEILGGNTVFADVNGNFNIPSGATGDVTVRSPLRGQWFTVEDDTAGGSLPSMDVTVAAPGTVDILHNPTATEFPTSNVNCYLHANIVRDFVLSFEPSFPTIATQTFFRVTSNNDNISGITSCNATYNGSAINFMRNLGDCNNTSIPDVVYHEYGHHLVSVTGNGQGQFGEGSGDTMGVLIEDNPDLALGFFEGQCSTPLRSANNFRTYPCSGGIHDCGQLIAGCVWDCINEIRTVDPTNARDITAELFVGMLIVRGQMVPGNSTIDPLITLIFVQLDDDDAEVGNGSPHYQQIADAFNPHNMDAPPLQLFGVNFPGGLPDSINPAGGDQFEIEITPFSATPISGTGMLHVDTGSGFQSIPLVENSATNFTAQFPASTCGDEVEYYVSFDSTAGPTVTAPLDAPASTFAALSAASLSIAFSDSFDTDLGWTVSGNASTGQWERAIPNNGDRGDPAEDAEETGAGNCYVTDNSNTPNNDNTDVDNGNTILTSPILDATAGPDQIPFIAYYRWYANNTGGSGDDVMEIEISNNGGSTWVDLETIGPGGNEVNGGWIYRQIRISDFVTPTADMRVRFIATDTGSASIVEAGVDAVEVQLIECAPDVLHGDVNLDGVVDLLDVGPFVAILSAGGFQAEADVNKDGVVSLLDVQALVDLITGA